MIYVKVYTTFYFLKVIFYIWHSHYISGLVTEKVLASQAPICSLLIYNPERRQEAWRFLTYQFVHVNMEHIVFNTLMQLVVGLPLEMSQPGTTGTVKVSLRCNTVVHCTGQVVLVYLAGVALGSVGGSLHNPASYLAGASAGVGAAASSPSNIQIISFDPQKYIL